MAKPLTWTNETRKLRDLKPQKDNPRQIRKAQAERLVKSFDEFSQVDAIACNPDGTILNGHQRYHVLLAAYDDPDYTVDVRVPSRPLTRKEWQKLTVYLHEGAAGEWDWEGLAEWEGVDVDDLLEWGFDEQALLGGGLGSLPSIDELWQGMPEFEQENLIFRTIKVFFANDEDIIAFAELIEQKFTDKTKAIWYPKAEIGRMNKIYKDES